MPACAIAFAFSRKPGIPAPGIAKSTICRASPRPSRWDRAGSRYRHVAIEDVVQVLVGGDARTKLLGRLVIGDRAGVPMGDPCRELLDRREHDAVERSLLREPRVPTAQRLIHASRSSAVGVDASGDREVVAEHDRVSPLLCRPPSYPLAPRLLVTERSPDAQVVVGEVVLRQQVDLQRRLRHVGQVADRRDAMAPDVVAAFLVWHVVVRQPLFRRPEMPVEGRARRRASDRAGSPLEWDGTRSFTTSCSPRWGPASAASCGMVCIVSGR